MSNQLTQTQTAFINQYLKVRDIDAVLSNLNLTFHHVVKWCDNPYFDMEYRSAKQFILRSRKEESALMATEYIHKILSDGCVRERVFSTKTMCNSDGEIVAIQTEQKTVERPIPVPILLQALGNSSTLKAIEQLANEGLLGNSQYKQLISLSEKISDEANKIMTHENEQNEEISEKRAIALIKQAVLGVLEE